MNFNKDRFRKQCRTVTQSKIAEALGKTERTVQNRLKNLDDLTFNEFFAICEVIDENPETFLEKEGE